MEPVLIRVANDLSTLPVVLACARACAELAGFKGLEGNEIELVMEEIFTNILKYEYIQGYKETVEIEWRGDPLGLQATVRFKGIPFDLEGLRKSEQVALEDIFEGEAQGIGSRLIKQLARELVYKNRGKAGLEIAWRHYLKNPDISVEKTSSSPGANHPAKDIKYEIRRMRSDEAASVSKLAFLAYNISYVYEQIYFPERVRELNKAGELFSFVAVGEADHEVIGHSALIPCELSGLGELGMAFVDPRFRGGGCVQKLTQALIDLAVEHKMSGVFALTVTSHDYSQKAALRYGLRESALLVSRVPALTLRGIVDENSRRESLLLALRFFDSKPRGPIYAPLRHRKIIEEIYENTGTAAIEILADADTAAVADDRLKTELEVKTDNCQTASIRVCKYGADALSQVQKTLFACCRNRVETIYLYLSLKAPATCWLCPQFEKLSFFFCGVYPGRDGDDWLMLQYLNNPKYDYDLIRVHSPFAARLLDYVRKADPGEKSEE
ncbi:MAG: GNAT family N-acetyltransferase [Syntrophobacteraceae bacterium]